MIRNKEILILGGAGFIGFYLAKRLLNNNKITIVDNLSKIKRKDQQLEKLLKIKNIKFHQKDIRKINPNNFPRNFHYIFDCAAIVGVKKVIRKSYFSLENNIKTTLNTIEIAKERKMNMIHVYVVLRFRTFTGIPAIFSELQ